MIGVLLHINQSVIKETKTLHLRIASYKNVLREEVVGYGFIMGLKSREGNCFATNLLQPRPHVSLSRRKITKV
jgi:hypothetical protein